MIFRRRPFADVIRRQLALFERENADLIAQVREAERAYDRAERDEAEKLYGDYADLVRAGTDALAELRDAYASTLADEHAAETYEAAFNREVIKRLPVFALELEQP